MIFINMQDFIFSPYKIKLHFNILSECLPILIFKSAKRPLANKLNHYKKFCILWHLICDPCLKTASKFKLRRLCDCCSSTAASFMCENWNTLYQSRFGPNPYLLILLSLNLIFLSTNPLLGLQQLYPKILARNLHHICFSFLSNNHEYFFKAKF